MTPASVSQRLRDALVSQAGGFLANPVFEPGTCPVCAAPIGPGWTHCARCHQAQSHWGTLADLVGSSIYARPDHQTAFVMYGYKASSPQTQHRQIVQLLLADALLSHRACAERLVGMPIKRWTTVPSLTKKRAGHPLRDMVRPFMTKAREVMVEATDSPTTPRSVTPSNFIVENDAVEGKHVLVVDDTWTTGAQSQSVAVALKDAGAAKVTIYTVARWLDPTWGPTKAFLDARKARNPKPKYDPAICPFTHGACP